VPASPITASTRYFRPGFTKVYFVASISNKAAPTSGELNAGIDLSGEIADVDGWNVASDLVETPDLGSAFVSKIIGRTNADDSSLTLYASSNSVDVRSTLPRGTTGFIVWLDEGQTTGRKMDVFPITVASAPKQRGLEDPARIQIMFAITSTPAENVTVP
jgi:hypothetical protein